MYKRKSLLLLDFLNMTNKQEKREYLQKEEQ
jgi:hypothetical protein